MAVYKFYEISDKFKFLFPSESHIIYWTLL